MQLMTTDMSNDYGKIEIRSNKVVRTKKNKVLYEIPVTDIKVVGEFTNGNGPNVDDCFLVIVTKDDWFEIPMDIVDVDHMLKDLSTLLGTTLNYELTKSIVWKTRIMYPDKAKEKEIYEIVGVEPKTFWGSIKKLIGLQETVRQFSEETKKLITE